MHLGFGPSDFAGHLVKDVREVRYLALVLVEAVDTPLLPVSRADVVIFRQLVL